MLRSTPILTHEKHFEHCLIYQRYKTYQITFLDLFQDSTFVHIQQLDVIQIKEPKFSMFDRIEICFFKKCLTCSVVFLRSECFYCLVRKWEKYSSRKHLDSLQSSSILSCHILNASRLIVMFKFILGCMQPFSVASSSRSAFPWSI